MSTATKLWHCFRPVIEHGKPVTPETALCGHRDTHPDKPLFGGVIEGTRCPECLRLHRETGNAYRRAA